MYISKIVNYENMQRCLSIGRRAAKPALVTAGVLLSTYELLKQSLMQSGRLEESLSKVTSSKIGIHEGTVNSRSELLKRLKRYRMLFGIVNTSRESQILARLEHAIEDMETDVSTGALRKQPFCVVLYGNPGVGKSSFSIQLAKKLMHGRYGRFTSHDMVTLNETDEYQSEFRTSHKVVLFDDIGAAKVDRPDTSNPWRKVIDFVNNVQKTALNPNCEMKGKVYIQPDLVILTTNLDLSRTFAQVGGFMNCPEAIARRCSSVIHLKDYHTGVVINYDGGNTHNGAFCGKMPSNLAYGHQTVITREAIVTQLDEQFREHMIDQQNFVDKFNSYFDDLPTIDEVYEEQSEIYVVQADVAPKYDPLSEERRLNYLVANIDWDYYFCAYPEGHYSDVYYFDGYIYSSFGKYPDQAFYIHKDYMNELRQKMLDITPDPYKDQEVMDIPDLVAEGNTMSIVAESDTCIVSDFLEDAFVEGDELGNIFAQGDPRHNLMLSEFYISPQHSQKHQLHALIARLLAMMDDPFRLLKFLDDENISISTKFEHQIRCGKVMTQRSTRRKYLYAVCFGLDCFPFSPQRLACYLFNFPPFGMNRLTRVRCHDVLSSFASLKYTYDELLEHFAPKFTFDFEKYAYSKTPANPITGSNSFELEIPSPFNWAESIDSTQSVLSQDCSTDTPPESTTGDSHYRDLLREKVAGSINSDGSLSQDSQTERQQCDSFLRILNLPKQEATQIHRNIQFHPFGEIDMAIEIDDVIIVLEVKCSDKRSQVQKAQKQADRYGAMISILRPETRVFGIIYTYKGIKVRYDNGLYYESNVCDDLFSTIGYTKL